MNNVADVIMTGETSGNYFGNSVSSAGDVNGDGYTDVIVGSYLYSSNTGRAYIYFGGGSMNNVVDLTMTGETTSDFFGKSLLYVQNKSTRKLIVSAPSLEDGIAYIYDKGNHVAHGCNRGSVDLKALHQNSIKEVRSMLENHVNYTDSAVAKAILANWDEEIQHFVRVMPRDYARVLKQQQQVEPEVTHAS